MISGMCPNAHGSLSRTVARLADVVYAHCGSHPSTLHIGQRYLTCDKRGQGIRDGLDAGDLTTGIREITAGEVVFTNRHVRAFAGAQRDASLSEDLERRRAGHDGRGIPPVLARRSTRDTLIFYKGLRIAPRTHRHAGI